MYLDLLPWRIVYKYKEHKIHRSAHLVAYIKLFNLPEMEDVLIEERIVRMHQMLHQYSGTTRLRWLKQSRHWEQQRQQMKRTLLWCCIALTLREFSKSLSERPFQKVLLILSLSLAISFLRLTWLCTFRTDMLARCYCQFLRPSRGHPDVSPQPKWHIALKSR
jgi:hypothetical protein